MEFLSSQNPEHLLQAESSEWLEEIDFIENEARFFEILLKHFSEASAEKKEQAVFKALQRASLYFNDIALMNSKIAIMKHGQLLAMLMRNSNKESLADYQCNHAKLKTEFEDLRTNFREHKKRFYAWVHKQR